MIIGVNARLIRSDGMAGIGWFSYHCMLRWVKDHPEHTFVLFSDAHPHPDFEKFSNIHFVRLYPPTKLPILIRFYFHKVLASALARHKIEAFVSLDGFMPLSLNIPSLCVIHDLNFEHPQNFIKRKDFLRLYKQYFPQYARIASRIATVSEYSKQDIIKFYTIDAEKIDVVYNGSSQDFHPISEQEAYNTKIQYTNGKDYFVYVGSLNSRKNLGNLFKAFDIFKENDQANHKLVLAGEKKWWKGESELRLCYEKMKYREDVIFTDYLRTEELNRILGASVALAYPSFFEGFGIPILEAFSAETAVLTSDRSAMPEIGKEGALYVDPYNIDSIVEGFTKLASDPALRNRLIEKGKERREDFSWDRTAQLLWESFLKMLPLDYCISNQD